MDDISTNIIFYLAITIAFFRVIYSVNKNNTSSSIIFFHLNLIISTFLILLIHDMRALTLIEVNRNIPEILILNIQLSFYLIFSRTYKPEKHIFQSIPEILLIILTGMFFIKNNIDWMHGVILSFEAFLFYILYNFTHNKNISRYAFHMFLSVLLISISWIILISDKPETSALVTILFTSAVFILSSSLDTFFFRKRLRTMLDLLINTLVYSTIIIISALILTSFSAELENQLIYDILMLISVTIILVVSIFINIKSKLLLLFEKIIYPRAYDFRRKLKDTYSYAQSIVKWEQFISYLKGLFGEFYKIENLSVLIIDLENNQLHTDYRESTQKTVLLSNEQKEQLKNSFISTNYILKGDIASSYDFLSANDLLLKVNENSKSITLIRVDFSQENVSDYEVFMITSRLLILKRVVSHIKLFENKKSELFDQLKTTKEGMNISALQTENLVLKRSYEQIRALQAELVSKEREAALAKFTMSLDDDISTPLSNMYMSVSYFLQKYENKKSYKNEDAKNLLNIIVSQSNRIKELLEKLRRITDNPENRDKLIIGQMNSFFSEKGQES